MTDSSAPSSSLIWPILITGTKILSAIILAIAGAIYLNQDRLLYMPNPPGFPKTPDENPPGFTAPSEWTKDGRLFQRLRNKDETQKIPFEDVIITTNDGAALHAWLMLQDDNDAHHHPTLIYFHGNAGNMGFRMKNAVDMYSKVKINILMMDYRGYGKSTGTPNETGLQLDGQAVLKFVLNHPKLKGCPVIVFGRSLGGAVSFYLAEKYPTQVHGVIVENTFLSISAMVDKLMPFLTPLKSLLLKINWNSDDKVTRVKQPVLFISGDSDELVPPFHMKDLFELAKQSSHREFYSVSGGQHNDTWEKAGLEYYLRLKQFIDAYVRTTSTANAAQTRDSTRSTTAVEDSTINLQDPVDLEHIAEQEAEATVNGEPVPETQRREAGDGNDDENDYYFVNNNNLSSMGLPTMDTKFRVKPAH